MKNKDSADRTNPVSKKDQAEDFDLAEVSGEELFIRDNDIIGFFEEPPVMPVHTDETLENDAENDFQDEDVELDVEMIMSPPDVEESDTALPYHEYAKEGEAAQLKIGDVLDPDAEMVIGSEDGDETISGLEGDFLDPEEEESDTSERIIVNDKIEDMIPRYDSEPEPEPDIEEEPDILEEKVLEPYEDIPEEEMSIVESVEDVSEDQPESEEQSEDDDVLELAEDSIIVPPDKKPVVEKTVVAIIDEDQKDEDIEQDETIELVELVEEVDKDSLEIRDIEDILGLGSEVLENTRELIVPIGFHHSEPSDIHTNFSESPSLSGAGKERFHEDSTGGDLMTEVEKMLAAQEETHIAETADDHQSDITPDNIRETMLIADMPDGDISAIIEKASQENKAEIPYITPFEEKFDNKNDFIGIEAKADDSNQASDINDNFFDIDESSEQADDKEIFDVNAATIIASPHELGESSPQPSQEDDNLFNIDDSLELLSDKPSEPEKLFSDPANLLDIDEEFNIPADDLSDEDEEIFDADAATIIAPPSELTDRTEKTPQNDDNLLDIDIDLDVPTDKQDDEEIFDADAATIIAPPNEVIQPAEKILQGHDNLLDIDEDLNIPAGISDEDEEIFDADAATIIAPPNELTQPVGKTPQDDDLLDIDIDLDIPAEQLSENGDEDEEILDADAATIIASPHELEQITKSSRGEEELLDIDVEVQKLVKKASDDIEDFNLEDEDISNAATIIALPEKVTTQPKTEIDILTDDDIFDLSPDTIISEPTSSESKSMTTQKFDSSSLQTSEKDIDVQDAQTVFLQPEEDDTESLRKTPDIKPSEQAIITKPKSGIKEDGFAADILPEFRLPVRKEPPPPKVVEQVLEEPPADSDIVEGEIFEDEEKELLKFLEMELTPIDFPEARESDDEDRGIDEEDEYLPFEEVVKNPQEGESTVISEMIRPTSEAYEAKPDSAICLSITQDQMEAALERVIQKVFSEKIEHIVTQVIEKTFTEELEKKLRIILMQDDGNRR